MKTLVNPILENDSKDGWPVKVDLKVIAPGLVHYEDLKDQSGNKVGGNVLIRKEAFDKMAASCEGKPIVNWDHRKVDPKEFSRGTFQGVVTGPAIFNAADGWYHAPGLVWDKATLANIEAGYSISCAYMPTEMDETGGKYNAVPYMAEVMDGRYTHIAVVSSPRYNEARIELLNSQGGSMNLLAKLFGKGFENGADIDVEKSTVKMEDGTERPLSELINSFKKAEALKAAKTGVLPDDATIEIDGKKITVAELKNAELGLKNDADKEREKMEGEHKNDAHVSVPMKNCAMCNAAEEEKKKADEDKEKKNAAAAKEAKEKEAEELKNKAAAEAKEAAKRAADLEEKRNKGQKVDMPTPRSLRDMVAEGEARYGQTAGAK